MIFICTVLRCGPFKLLEMIIDNLKEKAGEERQEERNIDFDYFIGIAGCSTV